VGEDSYAERIAGQARAFRHPRSPLERALNRLLLWLVAVMAPLGLLLGASLLLRDTALADAVPKATAAMVSLVPEGLILLASLTFAVAAVRMARRGALAQQLNAIESLASADVICLDKTGTLTDAALRVTSLVPAPGVTEDDLAAALGRYAAAAPARNLTLEAFATAFPAQREEPSAQVPFASRRRWSALGLGDTTLVLGAPEILAAPGLVARVREETAAGRRAVALARTDIALDGRDPDLGPPPGCVPLGVAVLSERLRPDAAETVAFLRSEGIDLKVLSGDAPATVAAIAADAGIPGSDAPVDASHLPSGAEELRDLALSASVFGRIAPDDKRRVVEALRDSGRYVAMVGDGVNDVPALKAARLAIAQGSGAQMAKSVADVVLLSGDFATVPGMIAEGRRILRNVQRVARLFVAKAAFAAFLIVTVGVSSLDYPFLPRHLTVAATFGVGVPAFFLALAPSSGAWRPDRFLTELVRFSVPAGIAVGVAVLGAYLLALQALDLPLAEARTVATTVMLGGMLFLIVQLEGHTAGRTRLVEGLVVLMAASYVVVLLVPFTREFFALARPDALVAAISAGGVLAACGLAYAALRMSGADR
jgi:magnesium-transporting ATPase (P-type)